MSAAATGTGTTDAPAPDATSTSTTSADTGVDSTNDSSSDGASDDGAGDDSSGSITDALDLDKDSTDKAPGDATADTSGDDDGDGDGSPTGAPAEYSAFAMPDGVEWADETTKGLGDVARELNLTQDQAQKITDMVSGFQGVFAKETQDQQDAQYADFRKEELQKAKMDPELVGPDGDQWEATQTYVRQVVTKFAGKGTIGEGHFAQLVKDGVMDTHSFLVFMKNVGRALMPDSLDLGGDPGSDTSYDELPAKDRMDWDDNAEPIKK